MRRLLASLILLAAFTCLAGTAQADPTPTFLEWQQEENDCLYAAAAGWEAIELGAKPTEAQVFRAWWANGRQNTPGALNAYWTHHPIDGIRATVTPVQKPRAEEAMIVGLHIGNLPATAQWPRWYEYMPRSSEYHAVLMTERSRGGVRVVSWGREWLITYAEWRTMSPQYFQVQSVK